MLLIFFQTSYFMFLFMAFKKKMIPTFQCRTSRASHFLYWSVHWTSKAAVRLQDSSYISSFFKLLEIVRASVTRCPTVTTAGLHGAIWNLDPVCPIRILGFFILTDVCSTLFHPWESTFLRLEYIGEAVTWPLQSGLWFLYFSQRFPEPPRCLYAL